MPGTPTPAAPEPTRTAELATTVSKSWLKSDIWSRSHHRPAPGTGDPTKAKRKRKEDPNGSDIVDDVPERPEEAQMIHDMNNRQGLAASRLKSYNTVYGRWKNFCKDHKAEYAGVDGKGVYLVDLEDKLIAFMKEYYFDAHSSKHIKVGADVKTMVPVKKGMMVKF
ncbi:hypothetical protein BGX29_003781 [Mortierella sp. GBA35]|nr:hypothetical protein BGX23_003774 [Mortierella sp. AD031]KAF9082518.1 hypothetical protein BGX29_003781 [Mortierella sp. GBA35]KAG0196127.1 hypothetical protein BGX33_002050 [Mortierella sp. NVP41]